MTRHSVKLPALAEGATVATVVEWNVQVGQHVEAGATLVVVGLDKVDIDVPAPIGGTVAEITAQPGDDVAVGDVLAVLES